MLAAGTALGQGKGPQAGVSVTTECALDIGLGANLVVTTTVTNTSSGADTVAEVRPGSEIEAIYKKKSHPGNTFYLLAGHSLFAPVSVDPVIAVSMAVDLCLHRAQVEEARELNAKATIAYGIEGGFDATRTVVNRCKDNPDTPENEGGIYVEDAFPDIAAACGWIIE